MQPLLCKYVFSNDTDDDDDDNYNNNDWTTNKKNIIIYDINWSDKKLFTVKCANIKQKELHMLGVLTQCKPM